MNDSSEGARALRNVIRGWTAAIGPLVLVACGAGTPSSAGPAAPAKQGDAEIAAPTPGAATSASAVPHELGRVHLSQPEATLRKAVSLFPQYVPPMARDLRLVAEIAIGNRAAGLLAFDRPIDVQFFQHAPAPSVVITAEIRKGVDARADLSKHFPVEEQRDGVLQIRPSNPFGAELGRAKECELAKTGQTDTLACGSLEGLIGQSRAARPERPAASREIVIDFDVDAIKPQLLQGIETSAKSTPKEGDPSRAAGRAMGQAAVRSLFQELRGLELSGSLTDDAVTAALTIRLSQGRSLLATLLGSSEPPAPPPPRFFRLPVDSLGAFFSRGVDAKTWEPMKKAFVDAFAAKMSSEANYPEAILDEARRWMNDLILTGGPWMAAFGGRPMAAVDLLKGGAIDRLSKEEQRLAFDRGWKGWIVIGLDEPGDAYVAKLKSFVEFDQRADQVARSAPKKPHPPDKSRTTSTTRLAAASPALPAGTLHVVVHSVRADQPKNPKLATDVHFFAIPEGDHVWLGFSGDEKTLIEHMKGTLEGRPVSGTLSARAGVEAMSKGPALSTGGFLSLGAMLGMGSEMADADPTRLLARLKYVAAITSKGRAPYVVSIRRGDDASPEITIEATATPRALDELVGFVQLSQ